MIMIIIYAYLLLLIFTNIKSIFRIFKSYNFLKKNYNNNCETKKQYKNRIKIIIPAMNEVNNVERSINFFKNLSSYCDVIYVTTSKEKSKATYNEIKVQMKKQKTSNINVINSPNKFGTMANQINEAIKRTKKDDIIALYNIDSEPEEKTFKYVLNNINDNIVLQQISYFDDYQCGVLKSAQNWQNRWSITYELGRYLSNNKPIFKYCIGHGLFIKKSILDKIGLFSEKDINEDNEFGYRLIINGFDIKPIPYLEKADFAKTKMIYIKQQSTWVNGPLYALKYYRDNKKSIYNLIISLLNFKAFLSWWLFPLLSYIILFISFFINLKLFLVILLLLIFYITIINYISNNILIKYGYIKRKYSINIFFDLLFFIMHSFGCYITLYKILGRSNNIENKYNTDKS